MWLCTLPTKSAWFLVGAALQISPVRQLVHNVSLKTFFKFGLYRSPATTLRMVPACTLAPLSMTDQIRSTTPLRVMSAAGLQPIFATTSTYSIRRTSYFGAFCSVAGHRASWRIVLSSANLTLASANEVVGKLPIFICTRLLVTGLV